MRTSPSFLTWSRLLGLSIFLLASLAFARTLEAQPLPALDPFSAGTHYIVAFPDTTTNIYDPRYPSSMADVLALMLYSPVDNQVTVVGRSYNQTVMLKAGKFEVVYLNSSAVYTANTVVDASGVASNNTISVDAKSPVVVYCYMMTKFGGEMWTPLPVDRWGNDYYVSATPGEVVIDMAQDLKLKYVQRNKMGPAQVTILAAYDNTTVTIYPSSSIISAPLTVTLNAGQAYQIQSYVDTVASHSGTPQADIAGSRIQSNRPIGVISGNTRAQVVGEVTAFTSNSLKNMGMEWLAPVEQYGKQFVYTPTWDSRHITGVRGEKVAEKRGFELVRACGTSATPTKIYYIDSLYTDTATISNGKVKEYKIPAVKAHMIRSDRPAQVMMHSSAAVRYNGTVSGTAGSASYDSWGAYTVELVPREQWTTFAPYYAPSYPFETIHYINVIADTNALDMIYDENGAPFDFNMGHIPGSPFMWGTYQVTAGATHFLEGRDGATFFAYMYGLRQGYELYRPQSTRSPNEYQELIALSYGVPLAPERRILRGGDTLKIDTIPNPCGMHIRVRTLNTNPVGLRSAVLDVGAANAKLTVIEPADGAVIGFTSADFDVTPIDPLRDASGTVVITDRTGKTWRVPYSYTADRVNFNAGTFFDLGQVNLNEAKDTVITISNPLTKDICIKSIRLALGNQAMTIVSANPGGPFENPPSTISLPPGGTMQVVVKATPTLKDHTYRDTLRVAMCCAELRLPLRMGAAVPCIEVSDLDFGSLTLNQRKTLDLKICNQGGGTVTLTNQAGDAVITWLAENFTIDQQQLTALRNTTLGPGACVTVPVTFSASTPDTFAVTARVWASTRECRDTSVWRAVVRMPTTGVPAVTGSVESKLAITAVAPEPVSGRTAISFRVGGSATVRLEVYDAIGERVALLVDGRVESGERSVVWDASKVASGVYYCRLTAGGAVVTRALRVEH